MEKKKFPVHNVVHGATAEMGVTGVWDVKLFILTYFLQKDFYRHVSHWLAFRDISDTDEFILDKQFTAIR